MTATRVASLSEHAGLPWESLMSETRYGRYADGIESEIVSFALRKSCESGVLLDVGSEGGRRAKLFAERGWQVTALDVDPGALEVCKKRISNAVCTLVQSDQQQFPVQDESIDLALCIEVGPVIHRQWAPAEFARVLKPHGYLAGVCWNRNSWRGFLYHRRPNLRISGSHPLVGYPIGYVDFRRQMIENGFHFEKELGYAWGPFRRTSNSRLVDTWAVVEKYSGLQHLIRLSPMIAFVCRKF